MCVCVPPPPGSTGNSLLRFHPTFAPRFQEGEQTGSKKEEEIFEEEEAELPELWLGWLFWSFRTGVYIEETMCIDLRIKLDF
jgi:hypothetical protein